MGTILGIAIGVFVTILVARYYFKRTVSKKLSVYLSLNNRLFAGIESDVKKNLEFTYNTEEVKELQQIELIVANDGERAIRDCIEPLTIQISKQVKILDASILHRQPSDLHIKITAEDKGDNTASIKCEFPLLNSGEFFLIKLLLDGYINRSDLKCNILAEDLPRSFQTKHLPLSATREPKREVEWGGIVLGLVFLIITCAICLLLWNYYNLKPSIFPFPWQNFQPSWVETTALIIVSITVLGFSLIGIAALIGIAFGEFFEWGPSFPLPEELRGRSYVLTPLPSLRERQHDLIAKPDSSPDIMSTRETEQVPSNEDS